MAARNKLPLVQQARCGCWSSNWARTTGWRSSSTPGPRAWCCPRPRATASRRSSRPSTSLQAGRLDQRRRGHPARLRQARRELHHEGGTNRVILATDGDFNVGVTERGRAGPPDRGEGQERRLPERPRLRHGQPQGRHAREARRQGQRQLCLHRLRPGGAQGAGRGDGRRRS